MGDIAGFDGAKVALFIGEKLAVILRDESPELSYAGHWDLPGGGREGAETSFACVARECKEELGLSLRESNVLWSRAFTDASGGKRTVWFYVARLPETAERRVVFGDEGQRWTLMSPAVFLAHPKAIPAFQERLRIWMTA